MSSFLLEDFSPEANLQAIIICALVLSVLFFFVQNVRSSGQRWTFISLPTTSTKKEVLDSNVISYSRSSNPPREPGHWIPLDFQRPTASPFPNWSLTETKPLPYRPFRWGFYHITMGIRKMPWDEWIEIDNRYMSMHAMRAKRLRERGELVCRTAPEARPAAAELVMELAGYLPERYPSLFRREGEILINIATNERFDLTRLEDPATEDPMAIAARLVQDDLALMFEREDGQYYLLSAAIIQPGFWRLRDKFGQPLAQIHSAGRGVPGFRTKLQKGMENFFRRVSPDGPVIRYNYSFQADGCLDWSPSLGNEDSKTEDGIGWHNADPNPSIEQIYFRVERQTLRRLPRSGAVAFTIMTYFENVPDIAKEPGVPGRLASAIRGWDDDVSRYKGKRNYADVLLRYLDAKYQEQKDQGVVGDVEEHEGYPY